MKTGLLILPGIFVVVTTSGMVSAEGMMPVEITLVDEKATAYGTFQSHNQKVLANSGGIFMTHIRTRNEPYTAQQWRLSRSTDGGRTFATCYEATHATNPAAIESDEAGNLYLVRPDYLDNNSYLYFFAAADDYRNPRITPIPGSAAGKFALAYDAQRRQLYYCTQNHTFHVVGLDGTVKRSLPLLQPGAHAVMQYPSLYLDAKNTLHFAWTTSLPEKYLYWDIHYMRSDDGGTTWRKMDGTELPTPIIADDTGPTDRISLDDEFQVHTWLSNFLVRDGRGHFLYLAQTNPPRQHYMRYDLETGGRELDITPRFKGEKVELAGLDGFFAAAPDALYCIGHSPDDRIGCLVSHDNGANWRDRALSTEKIEGLYALGGCEKVTPDGKIIGSFTRRSTVSDPASDAQVCYFQIPAGSSQE